MNRQEFIQKIIELYPDTFKSDRVGHIQAWIEMYEKAIKKNWDFDKLMWYFSTEYKSTVIPPAPSFFFQYRMSVCRPKEHKIEVREEPTEEEKRACEEAKAKFFAKFEQWKKERSSLN